jgi:hypothetical protein
MKTQISLDAINLLLAEPEGNLKLDRLNVDEKVIGDAAKKTTEERKSEGQVGEKPELQVSERYNEEGADVTMISSDGVIFKVHSFLLVRSS